MAREERVILLKTDIDNSSAIKANAELTQSIAKLKAEQKELKKNTNGLTTATVKQTQEYVKTEAQIKSLQEDSRKYTKILKDQTKEQKANQRIVTKTNGSINSLRNALNINRDAYRSLTKFERENTVAGKQLVAIIKKQDKEYKNLSRSIGNSQVDVGNYGRALGGLKKVFGALGITFAITQLVSLGKELINLSQESKGVQFAFEKLGNEGVNAFERVKASTRGTLSNLDIKRSLVEFDNFNISLAETDTLFEFLAVRATQTGQSVDKLKSSLVEGLSKESKLRIDNLGISAKQLNDQLKITPNFVQAVAVIAKSEIAEAGGILDEAANSQSKWNSEIANSKEAIANNLGPAWSSFLATALGGLSRLSEGISNLFSTDLEILNKSKVKESKTAVTEFTSYIESVGDGYKEFGLELTKTNKDLSKDFLKTSIDRLGKLKKLEGASYATLVKFAEDNNVNVKSVQREGLATTITNLESRIEAVNNYADKEVVIEKKKTKVLTEAQIKAIEKAKVDREKRAKEISDNNIDITRQNITFNLSLIKDAGEKELAINANKYNVLREDTLTNEKLTNDQKTNLKNLYDQQEIEASRLINVKITEDKIKEQEKYFESVDNQFKLLQSLRSTDQENEIAELVLSYEEKYLLSEGNNELEVALAIEQAEKIAAIEKKYNDKSIEEERKKQRIKETIEQQKLQLASDAVGAALGFMDEESVAYKAFAVAQIGIDTYIAAQKAYSSQLIAGDPTSPIRAQIAAAIAVAIGVSNAGKIAGFAEGSESTGSLGFADYSNHTGMITGQGNISPLANGDNMLATIKTGEAILNNKQQGRLNNLLGFDAIKYAVKGYADGTTFTGASQTGAINNNVINNSNINNNSQSQENITYIVDVKDVARGLDDLNLKVKDATI